MRSLVPPFPVKGFLLFRVLLMKFDDSLLQQIIKCVFNLVPVSRQFVEGGVGAYRVFGGVGTIFLLSCVVFMT